MTAPDLRFGSVFFWILFAAALSPILAIVAWSGLPGRIMLVIFVLFLTDWAGGFNVNFHAIPSWMEIPAVPTKPTQPVVVQNDQMPPLVVLVPIDGQCGNSPLPCTPYLGVQKLRVPGHLRYGF